MESTAQSPAQSPAQSTAQYTGQSTAQYTAQSPAPLSSVVPDLQLPCPPEPTQQLTSSSQPTSPEELLADFTSMFKNTRNTAVRMGKYRGAETNTTPNWLLEIPAKLDISRRELEERRMIDKRRWDSVVKGDKGNELVLAAASVWNYLFSTSGVGQLPLLSNRGLQAILPELYETKLPIPWSMRENYLHNSYKQICRRFNVSGYSRRIFKQPELDDIHASIADASRSCVYLASKAIVPIGYESTPKVPLQAYCKAANINPSDLEEWVICCPVQQRQQPLIIKRWTDISIDLETVWPQFFDIMEPKKGRQRHPQAKEDNQHELGGTPSIFVEFCRGNSLAAQCNYKTAEQEQ